MLKSKALVRYAMLAFLFALPAGAGTSQADPMDKGSCEKGCGGDASCGKAASDWMKRMNLTEEQKNKIELIRVEQKQRVDAGMEQMRAEHKILREMLQGVATDDQLREQRKKAAVLHITIGDAMFDSMLRIRALLTPEQRKNMVMPHHGPMGRMEDGRGEKRDK
ncbi:MAG: Spy/CpxP family protein refolding chaperone [Nitrospinae bacterium]|nr:Spy/CpxP family protein refolding chaperone [Nitrospinota bacterium]